MSNLNAIRESVEVAIKTEEMGCRFYQKMARQFQEDNELKELFEALARDEKAHENYFRKLLTQAPGEIDPVSSQNALQFMKVMVLPELIQAERGTAVGINKIDSREDALERALKFEKDTLGYYWAMADLFGKHEVLHKIIEEEKRHILKITEYLLTGAKMRGIEDRFSGGS